MAEMRKDDIPSSVGCSEECTDYNLSCQFQRAVLREQQLKGMNRRNCTSFALHSHPLPDQLAAETNRLR
jgi:hypothetical protein